MSDNENQFQQQILFNENSDSVVQPTQHEAAVIIDNLAYQEAQLDYIEEQEKQQHSTNKHWLWRIIALLFFVITGYELFDFFLTGFTESPILTSLYGGLIVCLLFLFISGLMKEFIGLRLLKRQEHSRHQAQAILTDDAAYNAGDLCERIHQQISYDFSKASTDKWQQSLTLDLSNTERLQLYDLHILSEVDEKAIQDVAKYSSETMVMVAISPIAVVDMLILFWRNIKMIDKISGLYGLNLGYWSRIKLIKQVFRNMFLVGASDMLVDIGTDALGADLLGKLSGRMAQGFAAGMLTARLGLNTINSSRPLPFIQQKPKLSQVRKALLKQIKGLVLK